MRWGRRGSFRDKECDYLGAVSRRWAIIVVAAGLFAALTALALYVGLSVAWDLARAESEARRGIGQLDVSRMQASVEAVGSAQERLRSTPARVLRLVPGLGRNIRAADLVVDATLPATQAGVGVVEALDRFEESDLLKDGRVSLEALEALEGPLIRQVQTLRRLQTETEVARSGWLLPPVWSGLDRAEDRADRAVDAAEAALGMARAAPGFLGQQRPQRHLVLLLNNAELRGAGGVLTGVGTVTADRGRLSLGEFTSVHDLRERPPRKVAAPDDFVRRYGTYKADTTLWLNTSFSPHVPHVASVARSLYERVKGEETNGTIVVDPRGLASLLHPDALLEVPGHRVRARRLARYIYSDAYGQSADQPRRRDAIIDLGERAFQRVIEDGLARPQLASVGEAVGAGHIRFLSEDPDIAAAFGAADLTGDVQPDEEEHGMMVAAQNFGEGGGQGTKLDFWARRGVRLDCSLGATEADCRLHVRTTNETPSGLDDYVAGRPYGVLRSYVEVFVPGEAEVQAVTLDGRPHEFRVEPYVGMQSIGVYLEIGAGDEQEISVVFELPPDSSGYALRLTPQPLARDARVHVEMDAPADWTVRTRGYERAGEKGTAFTGRILVEARPDERKGLPRSWDRIRRFFGEPVPWF